jgi:hypothetical protein
MSSLSLKMKNSNHDLLQKNIPKSEHGIQEGYRLSPETYGGLSRKTNYAGIVARSDKIVSASPSE